MAGTQAVPLAFGHWARDGATAWPADLMRGRVLPRVQHHRHRSRGTAPRAQLHRRCIKDALSVGRRGI